MKNYTIFFYNKLKLIEEADIPSTAHAMTYKLLLALFPFLMFLMTVAGFLDLDIYDLINTIDNVVPVEALVLVESFGNQIIGVHMTGLMYASLALAVFSSTSAFRTLVAGINKAHGNADSRHPVLIWVVSFLLVIFFTAAFVLTMVGLVFRTHIEDFLIEFNVVAPALTWVYNLLVIASNIFVVMLAVLVMNYVSLYKKIPIKKIIPGSIFTVIVWIAASYGFSFFVSNFSRMATVYGSVAAVMVLMIWLNIICHVMLYGGVINALLMKPSEKIPAYTPDGKFL